MVEAQVQRVLFGSRQAQGDYRTPAQPEADAGAGQQSQGRTGKQPAQAWRRTAACGRLAFCRRGPRSRRLRHARLPLGGDARGGGTPCFSLTLGAVPGFGGRLTFRGHTRQGRSFGDLLDPHLFGSPRGGTSFGFCPLGGQPGQISLSPGAGSRGRCQFGGGPLAALGLGQGSLLRFDLHA